LVKLTKIIDKIKESRGSDGLKWEKLAHNPDSMDCLHCKYTEREDSIPKDKFTVKEFGGGTKTISQIEIVRGRHDDCIGWKF